MARIAGGRSLLGTAILAVALGGEASAHESWINKERRTNAAGEWCCNTFDCAIVPADKITLTAGGYLLETGELIPHANAALSGDSHYWRCRRPDGNTRCFFFPPPSM
jgi:hypothetical protein